MNNSIGYIYCTTNLINGKLYIGKRQISSFDSKYLGSGIHLSRAVNKYGKDSFSAMPLLFVRSADELNLQEKKMISTYRKALGEESLYNIAEGGEGGITWKNGAYPESTRLKMSLQRKGIRKSKEHIEKIRISNIGKNKGNPSPRRGVTLSQEIKDKIGASRKLRPANRKGVVLSEEVKKNMSAARLRYLDSLKNN